MDYENTPTEDTFSGQPARHDSDVQVGEETQQPEAPITFGAASFEGLKSLEPAIVKVWRLKTGIWLGVLVLGVLVFDILNFFETDRSIPFGVYPAFAFALGFSLTYWVPSLRYRYWKYELRPSELLLVRGIFNRVHTIVPLRRLQHLDVSQDLFEREYDLGKLIIHTAGTRSSDVELPGLAITEAERLRDEMKTFILDEAL